MVPLPLKQGGKTVSLVSQFDCGLFVKKHETDTFSPTPNGQHPFHPHAAEQAIMGIPGHRSVTLSRQ
ncbi:hypothetical protein VFPPC_15477 [Pochonia chlamydosporia 170]|uniref:Uncharacterized protein n=1 Tax=Pochonia chlamydosporia 170 TaxID=1380566 RepID=A0A179FVP5_METCM|nr:hypothetical protein VFPPC_15477 [Pochonia chlamydosporia 170]OAQ69725.1 hypothetical protein VFPPC_15477 [Pochonia chlamydosporia 170]